MKKILLILSFLIIQISLLAPPNCFLYKENAPCYEACEEAMKAIRLPQGAFESQVHFNKSLKLCPDFAYSYMEKAVPYLKRGLFMEWKQLIDKAVKLSPKEYLGYRGWCRLQFLRDYKGAIKDIEQLKTLVDSDIGFGQTGDYHLNIALALCYKELGDIDYARTLILQQLDTKNYYFGPYDYYHLGVLEFEAGNYELALSYLDKQTEVNDYLGEAYYFKALAFRSLNNKAMFELNIEKAEEEYRSGNLRMDMYTETMDKIYLSDILQVKEKGFNAQIQSK